VDTGRFPSLGNSMTLNGSFDFATSSDGETQTLKMNLVYTSDSGTYRVEATLLGVLNDSAVKCYEYETFFQ
jgi:hypothetical protein